MVNPGTALPNLVGAEDAVIPELFERRAAKTPDQIFLIWEGRRWTYREALSTLRGFAGYLRTHCSNQPPRVAIYLANQPAAMWAWLGAAFAGGVAVPLNRKHQGALLEDLLKRCRCDVLVTEHSALQDLPDLSSLGFRVILFADRLPERTALEGCQLFSEAMDEASYRPADVGPTDPACVLYTSGTTGPSKAVLIPHNQYCRAAGRLVDSFGLESTDVFHNWLPLYHLGGQLHMTMTAAVAGGTVALFPTFSGSQFWQQVEENGISVLCGFAAIMHFIWSLPERETDADSTLRVGIFAGIPPDLHLPFEQRFGMELGDNYGMTEADPITHPRAGIEPPSGSCGQAGEDFEIAIVDDEGSPLLAGELGEIAIRPLASGVMALGYEGDDAASAKAFRDGWFLTGDNGRLDADGFLYFKGRKANYIRRRGENISAEELETVMNGCELVEECAAVAVPSDVGEDEIKLVVVAAHPSVRPEDLHEFARRSMAGFMVPRYLEIVTELPRDDYGKLKLARLKAMGEGVWDARNPP